MRASPRFRCGLLDEALEPLARFVIVLDFLFGISEDALGHDGIIYADIIPD